MTTEEKQSGPDEDDVDLNGQEAVSGKTSPPKEAERTIQPPDPGGGLVIAPGTLSFGYGAVIGALVALLLCKRSCNVCCR